MNCFMQFCALMSASKSEIQAQFKGNLKCTLKCNLKFFVSLGILVSASLGAALTYPQVHSKMR